MVWLPDHIWEAQKAQKKGKGKGGGWGGGGGGGVQIIYLPASAAWGGNLVLLDGGFVHVGSVLRIPMKFGEKRLVLTYGFCPDGRSFLDPIFKTN